MRSRQLLLLVVGVAILVGLWVGLGASIGTDERSRSRVLRGQPAASTPGAMELQRPRERAPIVPPAAQPPARVAASPAPRETAAQVSLPAGPLRVVVVDAVSGNPLGGAHVRVVSKDTVSGQFLGENEAVTDAAGRAVLSPTLGTLTVAAWASESLFGEVTRAHHGGHEDAQVRVELGPLVTLAGRVTDPLGEPIAGVRVGNTVSAALGIGLVQTDEVGYFEFGYWKPDSMTLLSFRHPGFGVEHLTLAARADGSWARFETLGEEEWRSPGSLLEVTLNPSRAIRGRVVSQERMPVDGARVRVAGMIRSSDILGMRDEAEQETGPNGEFALGGLHPNVPYLVMCDAGARGVAVRLLRQDNAADDLQEIELAQPAAVSGGFVDRWQRPLRGAELELEVEDAASLLPRGTAEAGVAGLRMAISSTFALDQHGRFVAKGPPARESRLTVRLGGDVIWRTDLDLSAGDVDLGLVGVDVEVAELSGRLVGPMGEPVADASLEIFSERGFELAEVHSDERGEFAFAMPEDYGQVIVVVFRAEDGRPLARWQRAAGEFPVVLRADSIPPAAAPALVRVHPPR